MAAAVIAFTGPMRRHGACIPLVLVVCLHGMSAAAQSPADAQAAFDRGLAAFQALDYATALTSFQQAYVDSRRPELLVNISLTLERLNRPADAAHALREYLAIVPAALDRPRMEAHAADLEARSTPTPATIPTAPAVTPSPVVPTTPPVAVPVHGTSAPVWPWVLGASGLGVAIVGSVLVATASDPGTDPTVTRESDWARAETSANRQRWAGGIVGGVGLSAAVVGLVLGLRARPTEQPPAVAWGLAPVPGGALLGVSVHGM